MSDSYDHMDCSPPGSSVHGISQARILEWISIPFSRRSSWPRDQTWVSCIAGGFFTAEPLGKHVNWPQLYIDHLPLEPPSPPHPTPRDHHKHQAGLPVLHSDFPIAICFTRSGVSTSLLLSPFVLLSPSPTGSTSQFSMSVSPFLPCKNVHHNHFSRFHIYALICNIFSFWLTSLCKTGSKVHHLTRTDSNAFFFMDEYYSIAYTYLIFFIHASVNVAFISWPTSTSPSQVPQYT